MENSIPFPTKVLFLSPDGSTYNGELRNGKPHGQGTTTRADGTVEYKGQFINGMVHGHGTFSHPDGSNYKGEFKNNDPHGHGVLTLTDGTTLIGEFVNGKMHGTGVRNDPDGTRYEGEFNEGWQNGNGVFTFSDGSKYDGQWREGMMHGRGKLFNSFGIIIYHGMFIDNIPACGCPRASGAEVGETESNDGVASISPRLQTLSTEGTHSQEEETKCASRTSKNHPCAQCGKVPRGGVVFLACGKCRKVSYCDSKCQHAAWNVHKKICKPQKGK